MDHEIPPIDKLLEIAWKTTSDYVHVNDGLELCSRHAFFWCFPANPSHIENVFLSGSFLSGSLLSILHFLSMNNAMGKLRHCLDLFQRKEFCMYLRNLIFTHCAEGLLSACSEELFAAVF